jgi:hypothetical protein
MLLDELKTSQLPTLPIRFNKKPAAPKGAAGFFVSQVE